MSWRQPRRRTGGGEPGDQPAPGTGFWVGDEATLLTSLGTRREGLTSAEAESRQAEAGPRVHARRPMARWRLAVRQVQNPIMLLLIGAASVSLVLSDRTDATIILIIIALSATLGFVQERGAALAVEDLMAGVTARATVCRDGIDVLVPLDDVVRGDLLRLRAGDVISGDARVLEADSLLVDESALTGESYPLEKQPGTGSEVLDGARSNAIWSGTHVVSGTGSAIVAVVGSATEFGRVGARVAGTHLPSSFEIGLRRFGYLLMRTTAVLVAGIFVANLLLHRPVLESFLFSLALAVGLTPQLLPTIVTVTLAHGARALSRRQVIVKRLDAIEDVGAIDVLCTDKTGTLTEGVVVFEEALDPDGSPSPEVLTLGWMNASAQSGFVNPVDAALVAAAPPDPTPFAVIDELPYDFTRRRLSVLVEQHGVRTIITKGAFEEVLAACRRPAGGVAPLQRRFEELSAEGLRVLAVASRVVSGPTPGPLTVDEESELTFQGLLCFADPPKPDAAAAVDELAGLGVATRLITGDNRYAAAHAAVAVGLDADRLLVGRDLDGLDDGALDRAVADTIVFAEVDPLRKEAIVASLRRTGHTVGYLGDGINDAPSLRTADVGISVDTAVDIARHSADVVLLDKDLQVLRDGISHGRRVFANTIKYVQVTISANFGNMLSMAAAALVLPFLPLLPRQILLLNFLSDIPGMTIAADRVDPETVDSPHGWDTGQLRQFMIVFGLISSAFDLLTFFVLRTVFQAGAEQFRTGWFIESTATELAVMLVLRTRRPAWRSRPAAPLLLSSGLVALVTLAVPYTPLAADVGLDRPMPAVLAALAAITAAYVATTELAKQRTGRTLTSP